MPLTYEEAVAAARGHLVFLNSTDPSFYTVYRYVPTEGVATDDGWFFSFKVERVDGQPLQYKRDARGGPPGFIVSAADGSVRAITWGEKADRKIDAG